MGESWEPDTKWLLVDGIVRVKEKEEKSLAKNTEGRSLGTFAK